MAIAHGTTPHEWLCLGCGSEQADPWQPCKRCSLRCNWAPVTFTISGLPVSQKNGRTLTARGGRLRSFASPEVRAWHNDAAVELALQRNLCGLSSPLDLIGKRHRELRCALVVYQGARQHLDTDNAAAAPLDALKRAGIVSNDYWINPLSITRRVDERKPRVEVSLEPFIY